MIFWTYNTALIEKSEGHQVSGVVNYPDDEASFRESKKRNAWFHNVRKFAVSSSRVLRLSFPQSTSPRRAENVCNRSNTVADVTTRRVYRRQMRPHASSGFHPRRGVP